MFEIKTHPFNPGRNIYHWHGVISKEKTKASAKEIEDCLLNSKELFSTGNALPLLLYWGAKRSFVEFYASGAAFCAFTVVDFGRLQTSFSQCATICDKMNAYYDVELWMNGLTLSAFERHLDPYSESR